ncbi:hypothetical protein F4054_19080 [Candidatus Poribacteria bacterium]|nr:hypothetical protein [Candidatus Poribacteria bacterium]MYF79886.1 hypothetical protein [Chloroflexota bacterium]MYK24347.1 hypothetical protein [Candidatus Poribacteria bacterium]
MVRNILSNRLLIGLLILVICAVAGLYLLQMQPPKEPIIIYKPVEVEEPVAKPPPPGASPNGHWHGDEWHAEPHETHDPPETLVPLEPAVEASRDYTPTVVEIPEGITDPEVLAAWQRVDDIANNIWEWGGVANAETPGLIAKLMPAPDGFSGPSGHSDMEETFNLLGSLDTNDPRTIEVLATYYCGGRVGGVDPRDMLVEMGVPAVPYLIPYILDMESSPVLRSRALEVLCQIGERHREGLDGIVEHIIVPRLEAILAQENPDYFEGRDAREYLPRLR